MAKYQLPISEAMQRGLNCYALEWANPQGETYEILDALKSAVDNCYIIEVGSQSGSFNVLVPGSEIVLNDDLMVPPPRRVMNRDLFMTWYDATGEAESEYVWEFDDNFYPWQADQTPNLRDILKTIALNRNLADVERFDPISREWIDLYVKHGYIALESHAVSFEGEGADYREMYIQLGLPLTRTRMSVTEKARTWLGE